MIRCSCFFYSLLVTLLLFSSSPGSTSRDTTEAGDASPIKELSGRIGELRAESKYQEAADVAGELLSLTAADASSKPHEIEDAKGLLETLRFIAKLDRASQREMAEADRLTMRIDSLRARSEFSEAVGPARTRLEIQQRILGREHREVAASMVQLATSLSVMGEREEAESLYRDALSVERALHGESHPGVAACLYGLGRMLRAKNDLDEAERVNREALSIRREAYGEDDHRTASSHAALSNVLRDKGEYDEAEAHARKALDAWRSAFGDVHSYVAMGVNNLANILQDKGELEEAESLLREALDIRKSLSGPEHASVAKSLDELAVVLKDQGDYAEAERLTREGLAMRRRIFGDRHAEVATSLNNVGIVLRAKGDPAGAEACYREAIDIRREALGERHPLTASTIGNLSNALRNQGKYNEAEMFAREALLAYREIYGNEHPAVAMCMNNLAAIADDMGDRQAAERLFRETLSMRRRLLGNEHHYVATSLANLASVLQSQGDHAGAEELSREALEMTRRLLGDDHPRVTLRLHNLGSVLRYRGDFEASERFYRESLDLCREVFGNDHPMVAANMRGLALARKSMGDLDGAGKLYREALTVARRATSDRHTQVAATLDQMGGLYLSTGELDKAERCRREALAIRMDYLGRDHGSTVGSLKGLAEALVARGAWEEAEALLERAADGFDAARVRAGTGLARAEFGESPYVTLAATKLQLGKNAEAWTAQERSFGRALADLLLTSDRRQLTPEEAATEDSLRRALAHWERETTALGKAADDDSAAGKRAVAEEARNRLFEAEARWASFQHEIALAHPVTEGRASTLEAVQQSLSHGTALIGWLDLKVGEDEWVSWAYAVREQGPVHWVRLGPPKEALEKGDPFRQGESFRRDLSEAASSRIATQIEARRLWDARLEPLGHALEGVDELIVIPSGAAMGIPIEAFADSDGVPAGELFAISYVPSATIWTWLEDRAASRHEPRRHRALLVGDPPFTVAHVEEMKREEMGEVVLASAGSFPDVTQLRGALAGNEDALTALPRLPGSRAEVAAVQLVTPEALVLIGPDASEQELSSLAEADSLRRFSTLHLATHALVDDERPEHSALVLSQIDLPDPLDAAIAGKRIYDGLLTASEIVREWDLDADLVTLSACETGLGKRVQGEGYIGLAHAFLQAGARSLVVSLWKVDDKATSMLMQRFYENWYGAYDDKRAGGDGRSMSKAKALQEAKRWLRTFQDEQGNTPYGDPYYWSAFILVGDRG